MASLLASCGRLSGRNCRIISPANMRRYVRIVQKKIGAICCQLPVVGRQGGIHIALNVQQFLLQFEFSLRRCIDIVVS